MPEDNSKTLSQAISEHVMEEIVRGELAPGMRLDEQSLADRFGVSRSPIRDALRQLAATRLVLYVPHRGFSVASAESAELDDLFEAASEVEAVCARLCALRATSLERQRLSALHEASVEAIRSKDQKRYASINDDLHHLIYAGAHNTALVEVATGLRQRLRPFRARIFFTRDNRMEASRTEHERLIAAILSHDAEAAWVAMHEHSAQSAMNAREGLPSHLKAPPLRRRA